MATLGLAQKSSDAADLSYVFQVLGFNPKIGNKMWQVKQMAQ
jgi:hypothetical protein